MLSNFFRRPERENKSESLVHGRRDFIARFTGAGALTISSRLGSIAEAEEELTPGYEPSNPRELLYPTPEPSSVIFSKESGSYAASFPILQNVSETSASVVWALNTPSTGWVEWGPTPELGKIARNSEFGLNPWEEDFISARLLGLAPETRYYYRTATCAFSYKNAYDKTCSEPQHSKIYSFVTPGSNAERASFAVMNDTHNQIPTIRALFDRFQALNPDFLVWNGDLCHRYPSSLIVKTTIANPCDMPYAAERPLILARGNHDYWGPYAHKFPKIFTPWIQSDPRFQDLGYNVAFRQGPIGVIILDTANTKADSAESCQGIFAADSYRERQTNWLEAAIRRPEIAKAPYLVAFCHIPLFDHTAAPDAIPEAPLKWSAYHECAKQFGPILDRSGVQILIAAHRHKFAYSEPTATRLWAQLLGGGPLLDKATCIHAEADASALTITCEKLSDGSVLGTWKFNPRI